MSDEGTQGKTRHANVASIVVDDLGNGPTLVWDTRYRDVFTFFRSQGRLFGSHPMGIACWIAARMGDGKVSLKSGSTVKDVYGEKLLAALEEHWPKRQEEAHEEKARGLFRLARSAFFAALTNAEVPHDGENVPPITFLDDKEVTGTFYPVTVPEDRFFHGKPAPTLTRPKIESKAQAASKETVDLVDDLLS